MARIEVIINSDEFNRQPCNSEEEAIAYIEEAKSKPHVVDAQAYDYDRPIDEECFLYWAKIDGKWEKL